jgi:hypothetical protein
MLRWETAPTMPHMEMLAAELEWRDGRETGEKYLVDIQLLMNENSTVIDETSFISLNQNKWNYQK